VVLQHLEQKTKYDLIHVDRHSDARTVESSSWIDKLSDVDSTTIRYWNEGADVVESPVICCVLPLHLLGFTPITLTGCCCDRRRGDEPQWQRIIKVTP
jgi:hypothetical protein